LDRRLGGPQSWSGRGGGEKNSQPLPGLKLPIAQEVTQHCKFNEIPDWRSTRIFFGKSLILVQTGPVKLVLCIKLKLDVTSFLK
jgi:hypothetical protein